MEYWYFETSALNELARNSNVHNAIATKAFQQVRGRIWVTSPVAFWEILLISDEVEKEKLIYFLQHLLHRELLPSPEEILIEYIINGFPLIEKERVMSSKSTIAETWRDLVDIPDKTFIYDKEELKKKVNLLKPVNKMIHQIMNNENVPILQTDTTSEIHISLDNLLTRLTFYKDIEHDKERKKIHKLAIFYMSFILCAEVGFENHFIQKFWKMLGIDSTEDRIYYALKNFEPLVNQGPLVVMAKMAYIQSKVKFSRGVFFDSLHAFYITYVDKFYTNDAHFKAFRNELGDHPNAMKIFHFDELKFTKHESDGNEVKSSIII